MPAGRRSRATFPRPVHPTNITGWVVEGDGTELDGSNTNRPGPNSESRGALAPLRMRRHYLIERASDTLTYTQSSRSVLPKPCQPQLGTPDALRVVQRTPIRSQCQIEKPVGRDR